MNTVVADIASTQALTMAIPLGVFAVVCLWGFFQRRPTKSRQSQ
jgi:hypothetical protein